MIGFMRQSELCRYLGISDKTWIRWRAAGAVEPPVNLPGAKKWKNEYIEQIKQGEVRPSGQGRRFFASPRRGTA